MYLLYPTIQNSYAIFQIPVGTTAEELATSFGLTMAQCAEFDMASFDPGAVNFPYNFTLVDNQPAANDAAFDLPGAKEQATTLTKTNSRTYQQAALNGFSSETLAAQATLAEVARIPAVQEAITEVNTLVVQLEENLAAITAATSVTEVSNIAYPPSGVISIGRGAAPEGDFDLNPSFYTVFNSASITEEETELYVPGTSTVIPYGSTPGGFDSLGNCFNPGNFLIQIRETYGSRVIAEFEVPLEPSNADITF